MSESISGLNTAEAAKRLGVSAKALRLYEQSGLIMPRRSSAGYRIYDIAEMSRAADVATLRRLGLSLAQVSAVINGDAETLDAALASHCTSLEQDIQSFLVKLKKARSLRTDLRTGKMPAKGEIQKLFDCRVAAITFDLPWPWGGERFHLSDIQAINYIIGSLGSGKTRLAIRIAERVPKAKFVGLDRLPRDAKSTEAILEGNCALHKRVLRALEWLCGEGAEQSDALIALLSEFESDVHRTIVIDMVEQGLDENTQLALIRYLRHNARHSKKTLFLLTRSAAILDLTAVGDEESIILCPANHSPPVRVAPYSGAPGYEAVALCLASPEVRARIAAPPNDRMENAPRSFTTA